MPDAPSLVWLQQDLRLDDQPALHAAIARKGPVIPVFIWAPEEEGTWPPGAASRWWLHQSLTSLQEQIEHKGGRLIIRRGPSLGTLRQLAKQTGAEAVFWNRRYEPAAKARDTRVESGLRGDGLYVESHNGSLLHEPGEICTKGGSPYRVFTPFSCVYFTTEPPAPPSGEPRRLPAPNSWPQSLKIVELGLKPKIDWAAGIREAWTPGTKGAHKELTRFLRRAVDDYAEGRDRPDEAGTSRMSPHLHFGEISPRRIWHAVAEHAKKSGSNRDRGAGDPYLRQLVWREFGQHLLYHFQETPDYPLRGEFEKFPWLENQRLLRAWQQGQTGYPIVDAGMRQLWVTGWMHNRIRMVVASFLIKDLLIAWQTGAKWFWDTLVDADLGNNTLGWQWVAGCGADASPYFRIFNPVSQGEKFDPQGKYVRRWVPELSSMPDRWIHAPWMAPAAVLKNAGVTLGKNYPKPLVDHAEARIRALEALQTVRKSRR